MAEPARNLKLHAMKPQVRGYVAPLEIFCHSAILTVIEATRSLTDKEGLALAAQRADDFSPAETEAIRRRMWMVMAAAGVFEKRDLAIVLEVSASTAGRWLQHPTSFIVHQFARALRGQGDLTDDALVLRDFLELRIDRFPWGDAPSEVADSETPETTLKGNSILRLVS